jgi:lycopene cyclase domain-containing protein
MTYGVFLAVFLVIPILILLWVQRKTLQRNDLMWLAVLMGIALIYTTPWDNYLVATHVWWYEPELVTGITIGWVPIEEYMFFLLQPLMVGLWTLHLSRHLPDVASRSMPRIQRAAVIATGAIWLGAIAILMAGWQPGRYLALILAWALPPVMLQLFAGADALWHQWRRVLIALASATVYLTAADALAIDGGTWTINPALSLNLYLGGVLPVEEFIFFFITNTMIVFTMTLVYAPLVRERIQKFRFAVQVQKAEGSAE